MAFIEISFNTKRPLILGRGGFGTQLNDWLMDEGWGSADFLDDNAPDAVGGLRDYVDPAILKRGRPAFVALGDNSCASSCCKSWQQRATARRFLSVTPRLSAPAPCWSRAASSCRRPMSVRTPIWAWAASSTREQS